MPLWSRLVPVASPCSDEGSIVAACRGRPSVEGRGDNRFIRRIRSCVSRYMRLAWWTAMSVVGFSRNACLFKAWKPTVRRGLPFFFAQCGRLGWRFCASRAFT